MIERLQKCQSLAGRPLELRRLEISSEAAKGPGEDQFHCDVKRETGWDFFWIYIRSIYIYRYNIWYSIYIYRYSLIKSFFCSNWELVIEFREVVHVSQKLCLNWHDEDQLTYAWALTRSWFNVDVQRGCGSIRNTGEYRSPCQFPLLEPPGKPIFTCKNLGFLYHWIGLRMVEGFFLS